MIPTVVLTHKISYKTIPEYHNKPVGKSLVYCGFGIPDLYIGMFFFIQDNPVPNLYISGAGLDFSIFAQLAKDRSP